MFRFLPRVLLLPVLLALLPGCNWDLDPGNFGFGSTSPGLHFVPRRFALGAKVTTEIEASGPDTVVSATDPDVIRVERVDSSHVKLSAVGLGTTTIQVEEDGQVADYPVDVLVHERHEVLLVQWSWGLVPIVEIDNRMLLADTPHEIIVALYDDEGLLFGAGLSDFVLPERSEACGSDPGASFDGLCIVVEKGLHVMQVEVAGEKEEIMFGAVAQEDIVDLLLVASKDEQDAEAGELLDVDLWGLTENGGRVYGLPGELVSPAFGIPGPFAYEFQPSSPVQQVSVEALGLETQIEIRGEIRLRSGLRHDCGSVLFWGC
ncbi:MAG: hypothetical protein WCE62_03545 [Polyangiales bacterium]